MTRNDCKICGGADVEYLLKVEGKRYSADEYFALSRCKKCNSVFIFPQPDNKSLSKYYPENYEPHNPKKIRTTRIRKIIMNPLRQYIYGDDHNQSRRDQNFIKNLLSGIFDTFSYRSIPLYRTNGRLLDIGCGIGSYLSIVKELGWQEFGVEPNLEASEYARQSLGLEVQDGGFDQTNFPEKYFDVITMWHSLEHFSEPRKIMQKIRRLLKDDGILMLGLPNFSSLDRKLFKESWNGLEIPLHVFHFSPDSIRCLLEETGFKCQKVIHTIRPGDMTKSLKNYLQDACHLKPNKLWALLSYIISIPMVILFSLLRRSSIIKVYAR